MDVLETHRVSNALAVGSFLDILTCGKSGLQQPQVHNADAFLGEDSHTGSPASPCEGTRVLVTEFVLQYGGKQVLTLSARC